MRVLVSWEIGDAALRRELARHMAELGLRLHRNLYECELSPARWRELQDYVQTLQLAEEDVLLVSPLCAHCLMRRQARGKLQAQDAWLII